MLFIGFGSEFGEIAVDDGYFRTKKGKTKTEWCMFSATVLMWAVATTHLHMRMWSLILAIRGDLFELVPLVFVVSNNYEGVRIYLPAFNVSILMTPL